MDYREVRKLYITARIENMNTRYSGNWRKGRKEEACREFDTFVQMERHKAIADWRLKNGCDCA